VGHGAIPAVAGAIALQWSDDALTDLNRFAAFLHEQSPELATIVGEAIVARTQILTRHPKLGRPSRAVKNTGSSCCRCWAATEVVPLELESDVSDEHSRSELYFCRRGHGG
jgi:plasmid stabilization system protein ParE